MALPFLSILIYCLAVALTNLRQTLPTVLLRCGQASSRPRVALPTATCRYVRRLVKGESGGFARALAQIGAWRAKSALEAV
eukprot:1200893-Pleurochrysis_carterae.AAC.2